jgi:proline iminopeptidase
MLSGTVDCDGFQLEWVREGRGIPMLVLGASRFYPRYFPPAMRDHFDMVFCDLRQWVPTPDGFDIATITRDTFSDDIERVRAATGLDRPIVVGQSHHGYMALAYARRYPDRVRGAVVIAISPPDYEDDSAAFFERDATPERRAADARIRASHRVAEPVVTSRDFIDRYLAEDAYFWFDPEADHSYLWEGVEINVGVYDQVWADEAFGGFRLETSDTPTFLALGRYDYLNPYYSWDTSLPLFSNLRSQLYERSAHQPPNEQPDEFTADVVDWARGLEASSLATR